ncbi:hypothetical protein BDV25DRAFT_138205 [Aspergillus avenaceus]|uniref:Uncharacterized protein n=1 Tax=Aspergillus avenaceus TaxID=36643 RepID=A0A5N6U0K0_ASPAV|nr:hypothetical protein BDV25DRAFT_138205 [Aspergillus avenaceus]
MLGLTPGKPDDVMIDMTALANKVDDALVQPFMTDIVNKQYALLKPHRHLTEFISITPHLTSAQSWCTDSVAKLKAASKSILWTCALKEGGRANGICAG